MYRFLYEVISTETQHTLPIYCTYAKKTKKKKKKGENMETEEESDNNTDENDEKTDMTEISDEEPETQLTDDKGMDLQIIPDIFATFPSDTALKQMASAFGLTNIHYNFFCSILRYIQ